MGVNYIYETHLIDRQYEAEQAMLKEFEAGNYTIQNPLVKYNLYIISPLSAVVCFETEEETAVTITVLGKTKQANMRLRNMCFRLSASILTMQIK